MSNDPGQRPAQPIAGFNGAPEKQKGAITAFRAERPQRVGGPLTGGGRRIQGEPGFTPMGKPLTPAATLVLHSHQDHTQCPPRNPDTPLHHTHAKPLKHTTTGRQGGKGTDPRRRPIGSPRRHSSWWDSGPSCG